MDDIKIVVISSVIIAALGTTREALGLIRNNRKDNDKKHKRGN